MKQIKDLIPGDPKKLLSNQPEQQNPTDDQGVILNALFSRLTAIFPAWKQAITSEYELKAVKAEWFKGLTAENCLTPDMIKKGLEQARKHNSPFFPSIGQFVGWCKNNGVDAEHRENAAMYIPFQRRIMPHTQEEYREMASRGMDKIRDIL